MGSFSNPKTTEYEFMGPYGSYLMVVGLPFITYALYFGCNGDHCSVLEVPELPEAFPWSTEAFLVVAGWFLFQVVLHAVLPGPVKQGLPLRDGSKLDYLLNGHTAYWVSLATVAAGHYTDVINLSYCYTNFLGLMTGMVVFSTLLALFVYIKAKTPGTMLAVGGNSGVAMYDFFIGHELNPRIGWFDIKFFCELRPGLIGWFVIVLGMAAQQYQNLEGGITNSMLLVVLFQGFYVWDAVHAEACILSTMDITTDGFGFMLAYGDLTWVPCLYSIQARYLVDHPADLAPWHVALVLLCQFLGYAIFRGANGQKDTFRRDPNDPEVAHLQYINTKRGTKLMISGWWGVARHINYTGDWLMALAWSLPCVHLLMQWLTGYQYVLRLTTYTEMRPGVTGFDHIIPYFYPIYFAILLIHRDRRDEHMCYQKYGADWDKYKKHVPYRMIPYIY